MRVKSVITLTKQSWKWSLMRKAAVMPESLTNALLLYSSPWPQLMGMISDTNQASKALRVRESSKVWQKRTQNR